MNFFIEWKNVLLVALVIWVISGMLSRLIICEKTRGAVYNMDDRKDRFFYSCMQKAKRRISLQGPIGLLRTIIFYVRLRRDFEYAKALRSVNGA